MGLVGTFKTMDHQELESLETIDPSPTAPWDNRGFPDVSIPTNKERALEEAASARHGGGVLVYTDASAKDAALGAAVLIQRDGSAETQLTYQIGIGSASEWHVHCAEITAISQEIKMIEENNFVNLLDDNSEQKPIIVLSGSQSAIMAMAGNKLRSGQMIVLEVLRRVKALRARGVKVRLQRILGHSGVAGNEAADRLPKGAVSLNKGHRFPRLLSK